MDTSRPRAIIGLDEALGRIDGLTAEQIPSLLSDAASTAGFGPLGLYLADLQEQLLVPWPPLEGLGTLSVDGSLAGLCFRRGEPVAAEGGTCWFPVTDGSQRLGVLSMGDGGDAEAATAAGMHLAGLAGLLLVVHTARCDSLVNARRAQEPSLAAELRWALMPPRVLDTGRVTVAGVLEPAYDIAGDSFDYALNRDRLHVAVFDAMGHGLPASRIANLAVTSYRHSRRAGLDLVATYTAMDQVISDSFGEGVFVTGHFVELDIVSGQMTVLNAGHPRPLLIRSGGVHSLDFAPATPIGLGFATAETAQLRLEPGDCVLIVSDGVIEARSAGGAMFGVERIGDLAVRALAAGENIPETVRRLSHGVLEHRGLALDDDATLLLLAWTPSAPPL